MCGLSRIGWRGGASPTSRLARQCASAYRMSSTTWTRIAPFALGSRDRDLDGCGPSLLRLRDQPDDDPDYFSAFAAVRRTRAKPFEGFRLKPSLGGRIANQAWPSSRVTTSR